MAVVPEKIHTPKGYWQTRRSAGHSDWSFGFWRELFQNAVDAGAKDISITVDEARGKGSFGRDATIDNVVRVSFTDDGHGMSERVLRDVFLKPGETTKRGAENIGGFGTARIMLCFSQVRYAVRTQDWIVEGDGSEYTCMTIPEAVQAKLGEIASAEAEGADVRVDQLRADLARLQADPGFMSGCNLEIDIDPQESSNSWENVNRGKLLSSLESYLSLSQLPCRVSLNGNEINLKALRGPARRQLVAVGEDGREVAFATVHTSLGERARHKGRLVVRVNGAAMFAEDTDASEQVIVEVSSELSRKVLTDNRDGMKLTYKNTLNAFLRELTLDKRSALADKEKRKHIKIAGGKGSIVVKPGDRDSQAPDVGFSGTIHFDSPSQKAPKALYVTAEDYRVHGFGGARAQDVDALLAAVEARETTFLDRFDTNSPALINFIRSVQDGRGSEALRDLSPELGSAIAATLTHRASEAAAKFEKDWYVDSHDIHIHVDDIDDKPRLKEAVRRYSPSYWRRKGESLEGRGMQAHMLLAAWTACCQEAVSTLVAIRPDIAKKGQVTFGTGFTFGGVTRHWRASESRFVDTATGATHQEREGDHVLLLNPVTLDGQPAYDLTKKHRKDGNDPIKGLQDLESLAIHEVAHMLENYHDEDFASLMTQVVSMFDRARAHERMREAVDAVRAIYGRGKSRIQAMDEATPAVSSEQETPNSSTKRKGRRQEPRPSEVLLAQAAPIATMTAGLASSRENDHLEATGLKETVFGSVSAVEPGVIEVDCDRIQSLETGLSALAKNDWHLDALALPPIEEIPSLDGPAATPAPSLEESIQISLEAVKAHRSSALDVPDERAVEAGSFDLGAFDLPPIDLIPALGPSALQTAPVVPAPMTVRPPRDQAILPVGGARTTPATPPAPAASVEPRQQPPGPSPEALRAMAALTGAFNLTPVEGNDPPAPASVPELPAAEAMPVAKLVEDEFDFADFDTPGPGR